MSRKIRSTIAAAIVTILACLAMNPAPAGAISRDGNDVDLRVVNNSSLSGDAQFCPNGHVNISYNFNVTHDPCNIITYSKNLHAHGGEVPSFKAARLGVIMRRHNHHGLYVYVRNPSIGKPYFVVNGHTYTMVAGELRTIHVHGGAIVRLHRQGDSGGRKMMILEIVKMQNHQ
ncbi:hypothetical protein [Patulibacter sp.]|uniref:hypothetical protein n=1 Tax=Patulibacter sp. TaxID=1912859 RepID=UPI002719085D|nr:hypothetical protein [Patulibacter sp.]MDO9410730.1 hypothetical protein [Patulibacter sp.]